MWGACTGRNLRDLVVTGWASSNGRFSDREIDDWLLKTVRRGYTNVGLRDLIDLLPMTGEMLRQLDENGELYEAIRERLVVLVGNGNVGILWGFMKIVPGAESVLVGLLRKRDFEQTIEEGLGKPVSSRCMAFLRRLQEIMQKAKELSSNGEIGGEIRKALEKSLGAWFFIA